MYKYNVFIRFWLNTICSFSIWRYTTVFKRWHTLYIMYTYVWSIFDYWSEYCHHIIRTIPTICMYREMYVYLYTFPRAQPIYWIIMHTLQILQYYNVWCTVLGTRTRRISNRMSFFFFFYRPYEKHGFVFWTLNSTKKKKNNNSYRIKYYFLCKSFCCVNSSSAPSPSFA